MFLINSFLNRLECRCIFLASDSDTNLHKPKGSRILIAGDTHAPESYRGVAWFQLFICLIDEEIRYIHIVALTGYTVEVPQVLTRCLVFSRLRTRWTESSTWRIVSSNCRSKLLWVWRQAGRVERAGRRRLNGSVYTCQVSAAHTAGKKGISKLIVIVQTQLAH